MYKYIIALLLIFNISAFGQLSDQPIGNVYDSAMIHLNGMAYDKAALEIVNVGGLKLTIEKEGGGDMIYRLMGVDHILDCTPKDTVVLTPGSDENTPQVNYVYVKNVSGTATLLASTSIPADSFAWVAKIIVPDTLTFNSTGALLFQRFTDAFTNDYRGSESHAREKERLVGVQYFSGVEPFSISIKTGTGVPDTVHLETSSGIVYQLHRQTYPAFTTGPYHYGNGLDIHEQITDISDALLTQDGTSMSNRRFVFVIWGAVNLTTGDCKMYINLPNDTYTNNSSAIDDFRNTADFTIPNDFKGVGFLISKIVLRHQTTSGGTWTELAIFSLLGSPPGVRAGGVSAGAGSSEFDDNLFRIFDNSDPTKILAFENSAISSGNTRTITMADEDIDLGEMMRDVGDTVSGTYNFSGNPLEFIRMIDFDDTITAPSHLEGRVFYDKTDNTLSYYNNEADVTMNLGQEGWVYARNITGSTILDGKIVYITGAVSSRPTIALAQADVEATSKLIGVATHDIETASNGYVTVWGVVRGINLSDFSDGDEVFLSAAVAGSLTTTAPSAPNYVVEVGYVIDASANGDLLVSTGKSKMLNSLGDVLVSGPTTGDILVYDGTAWANTGTFDEHWIFNIFSPNLVYDDDTQISIDPRTEAALTITRIDVTLDADPTTELEYSIKFADAFIGLANATVIEDTATVAGVTTVTSITGDATVPANKCIYIQFEADPDANITQVSINVTWGYD